jgi:glyoxylase-like metal-dependent hydrolase (beta-lactamase superfamily II)
VSLRERIIAGLVVAAAFIATACAGGSTGMNTPLTVTQGYVVHAARFATLQKFPKRSLIAGSPAADSLDLAMMIWVIRGGGRTILVDAGFYREKFMRQWRPADYIRPSEVLSEIGLRPSDVTDVILSHIHWDHADGADLFANARIWVQKDEYEYYVSDSGTVKQRAIDADVATMLHSLRKLGRVQLVDGDMLSIVPGITVYTGGKHTFASQYVGVHTRSGTVVIASDNAYLYENLEKRRPISQTLDSVSNLAAQARMLEIAGDPWRIVPGHDMQVLRKFPITGFTADRVARID